MNQHHDSMGGTIVKSIAWVLAWFATIKAADVQVIVSIISGVMVGALAAVNLYVTWRDKVRGK